MDDSILFLLIKIVEWKDTPNTIEYDANDMVYCQQTFT